MTRFKTIRMFALLRQATLFCVVGFTNLFVDTAAYYSAYHYGHFNYLAAQAVSYPCGAINSYFLNRRLTFAKRGGLNPYEMLRFGLLNVLSILGSMLALFVANHSLHVGLSASKVAANGTALCMNYAGSRWWVFRRHKAKVVVLRDELTPKDPQLGHVNEE
ncbi:GtrA family protein [Alicyclobacillus fastidiosus]|uniref:GtrA family protein n=2 Tax=Alicyclobacillus fastidiosus TaxID=392011 RepID=A0ABY6ZKV0_9BACL|nr:GtrA family protein [Alicyclobacillus fastidiosus]WAH42746.1 GtrA family protein [Alicyclobacillus fastidiosus]